MKNATRILIPSLSLGLLVKSLVVSQALAFSLYVDNQPPPGRDYFTQGALTGPNTVPALPGYRNLLQPDNGGLGQSYGTPTVVNFGTTQTFGGSPSVAGNSATFNGPSDPNANVQFTFALQNDVSGNQDAADPTVSGDPFDEFLVSGYLSGSVGYPTANSGNSTSKITFTSITNLTNPGAQLPFVITTNPNNGFLALYLKATVGANDYDIYLNQSQDISAPGKNALSISGFVQNAAVPEPGSMALLLGLGVTGSALLRRRKK